MSVLLSTVLFFSFFFVSDMNLFTTKSLMRQCGDHDVETREQVLSHNTPYTHYTHIHVHIRH